MTIPPSRPAAARRRTLALALSAIALSSCSDVTPPAEQVGDRIVFLSEPTQATAGLSINPAIRVAILDAKGEQVRLSGQDVTLQLVPAGPRDSLKGQTTSVFINGEAVFSSVGFDRTATGLRVAAVSKKLTGALSQPFNVIANTPSQLKFITQPSDVVAGDAISPAPVIEVQDNKGNRTTIFNGVVSLGVRTGRSGEIINNTVNCIDGLCTFPNVKLLRAAVGYTLGGQTLGATTPIGDAISSVFEVKAGPPTKLFFRQQPFNNLVNAVFDPPIRVEVVDTLNNIVSSAAPTITLSFSNNPNGATLGGTLAVAAASGVVDFRDISVNKAGVNYRLQAAATGMTTALSSFFSIVGSGAMRDGGLLAPQVQGMREPRREAAR